MIASNDDVNGENESDRRERFRIDDIAILQLILHKVSTSQPNTFLSHRRCSA